MEKLPESIVLNFIKKREKICMKCNKPIHWWQRKWRLIPFDYCVWHWECREYKSEKEREDYLRQLRKKRMEMITDLD